MNLLTAKELTKHYTDKELFTGADFSIEEKDKVGIVGINGTGKSTLLRILAGVEEPDEGEVVRGNKVYVRYLPQNPEFPKGMTIYDYVVTANKTEDNEWSIAGDSKAMLNQMGFLDENEVIDHLSGGQKKKVALKKLQAITSRKVTVKKGKKTTLKVANSPITAKASVKWKTSNKKVASVTSKGVVKGLKKGRATITAYSGKVKMTFKVTVK